MADKVVPILRQAVLCERIESDRDGRPFCFVPIHTIRFPPGVAENYRPPTLHLYIQLQEALGAFNLKAVLCRERIETELWRSDPESVVFDGRDNQIWPLELDVELADLVIPGPGDYEMWVFANHVNLHNPKRQPGWPFPPIRFKALGPDGTEGGVV